MPLRSFALLTSRMQILKFRNICAIKILHYAIVRALEIVVLIRIFQRCILKLEELSRRSLDSRLDRYKVGPSASKAVVLASILFYVTENVMAFCRTIVRTWHIKRCRKIPRTGHRFLRIHWFSHRQELSGQECATLNLAHLRKRTLVIKFLR